MNRSNNDISLWILEDVIYRSDLVNDIIKQTKISKIIQEVLSKTDLRQDKISPPSFRNWFHKKYDFDWWIEIFDITWLAWWNSHEVMLKIDLQNIWSYILKKLKSKDRMIQSWHELPHRAVNEFAAALVLQNHWSPVLFPELCISRWWSNEYLIYKFEEWFKKLSSMKYTKWQDFIDSTVDEIKNWLKELEYDLESKWLYLWDINEENIILDWIDDNWSIKYRLFDCLLLNKKPDTKIIFYADY